MISINNLTISFSGNNLFDDISFIVNDKDRIGLVGKNGAGKTTLLKIVSGDIESDKGTVAIPNETKIGFLPQEMVITTNKTIFDETLEAFAEVLQLEKQIKKYTTEISHRSDHESAEYYKLIEKLNDANEMYGILGGQTMFADTEKVLKGLGFTTEDFQRPVKNFSSGWQMRVELAKILLQKPDVILLDEPTNHLDIESIQWIEDYLVNFNGSIVLVSHDRAFLDNVTNRTVEISLGKIYDYAANYSKYVVLQEERINQLLSTYNNQQKEIKDIEKFVDRFRYKSTKARQVQSRIKKLNKMNIIEIDERDSSSIHFRFPPAPHSGEVVIDANNVSKEYDGKIILQDLNFKILKGERLSFVGRNGEGKTTLTKILTGEIKFNGELKLGHNVNIGYYAQNQSDLLDPQKTVLQTIEDIAVGDIRKNIRQILGSFLFSDDTVDKKVKVLSGGEKSRLALAKLLLTPVNLLILDEPTNHLDMTSKDILKNALLKYDGTLIIVSHDRDFLQGLTEKIFEFKNHNIKEFIGDIYDFLESRKLASLNDLQKKQKKNISFQNDKKNSISSDDREKRKEIDKKLKKINKDIQNSEIEITKIENEIKELNLKLTDPDIYKDFNNYSKLIERSDFLNKQLLKEMSHWEKLSNELNQINS